MPTFNSPCTRCGKPRIVEKTWIETRDTMAGTASVNYTKMVCPDKDCQKEVEEALNLDQIRRTESVRLRGQFSTASSFSKSNPTKKSSVKTL